MNLGDVLGITRFLNDYPEMSLAPSRSSSITLKGTFSFKANPGGGPVIADSYELQIKIYVSFPNTLPTVNEIGHKIPRNGKYHVNPDGTLCLGSPIRILSMISSRPTLVGFAERCIVPFLYAVSYKLQNGGEFVFSELAHGAKGIIDDYIDLFGLKTRKQVVQVLRLIGMKRRLANKKPCPCGCGKRLGKCVFNMKVRRYRTMASRSWYKGHASIVEAGV